MDLKVGNIKCNRPLFGGEKIKPMSNDDLTFKLINASMEYLNNAVEREVPENGKFTKVYVSFDIPESSNLGLLYVTHDEEDPKTKRRLILGVRHKNRDRLVSNQLLTGTKEDILKYLSDLNNKAEIKALLCDLSNKSDEYYSDFNF